MKKLILLILLLLSVFLAWCGQNKSANLHFKDNKMLVVKPLDFHNNGFIPNMFTCDGENLFPKFELEKIPAWTKNIVLFVEDPDAPTPRPFVHLMAVNISPNTKIIDENALQSAILWINDFGNTSWDGPCPPKGHWIHHYYFKFFAFENTFNLPAWFSLDEFLKAIESNSDKLLGYTEIVGKYER